MPITATPIDGRYEYAIVLPQLSYLTYYLNFTGGDMAYGDDGNILPGGYTGYTFEYGLTGNTGDRTSIITSQGIAGTAGALDLPQIETLTTFLFLVYANAISPLGDFAGFEPKVTFSGVDDAVLSGSAATDVFDLHGAGAVVLTKGGNDRVTTQNTAEINYANLGGGSDQFQGGAGENRVWGANGDDTLTGGTNADKLVGGNGRDHLEGGGGSDLLLGGSDADFLRGGIGDDSLQGGSANDVLIANAGDDKLWGGTGRDAFVFNLHPVDLALEAGVNQIRDFDVSEDFLWIVDGYNGNSFDSADGYAAFMAGAEQRDWGVLYREGNVKITLSDVTLGDLMVDHFVPELSQQGVDFGYNAWPDLDLETWAL